MRRWDSRVLRVETSALEAKQLQSNERAQNQSDLRNVTSRSTSAYPSARCAE